MVRARKPARKRDGRPGPPDRYPKDPSKYADPANWKYPVHTPVHARLARRYFNKPANRAKYSTGEQAYVDRKINEALERFGVAIEPAPEERLEAGTIQAVVPLDKDIDRMTLDELLLVLLGKGRLASARDLCDVASVDKASSTLLGGRVKDYTVLVDIAERRIAHDCADWVRNRARMRLLCKHLGAFLLRIDTRTSVPLLRRLLRERDAWTFA